MVSSTFVLFFFFFFRDMETTRFADISFRFSRQMMNSEWLWPTLCALYAASCLYWLFQRFAGDNNNKTPACCPANSCPRLCNKAYRRLGRMVQLSVSSVFSFWLFPPVLIASYSCIVYMRGYQEDGAQAYVVGSAQKSGKGILVWPDIFGPHSGRTHQICDELAAKGPYLVVLAYPFSSFEEQHQHQQEGWDEGSTGHGWSESSPLNMYNHPEERGLFRLVMMGLRAVGCIFAGPRLGLWICNYPWQGTVAAKEEEKKTKAGGKRFLHTSGARGHGIGSYYFPLLSRYLAREGVSACGVLGFCWGAWATINSCADERTRERAEQRKHGVVFKAGAACHPSCGIMGVILRENFREVVERVNVPMMILSAGVDERLTKAQGMCDLVWQGKKSIRNRCVFQEFTSQRHGWVNRGDLDDLATRKAVQEAVNMFTNFFALHV